jgi:hypothetical protein
MMDKTRAGISLATSGSRRVESTDSRVPISSEIIPGCRTALMALGGIAGEMGLPPFEFATLTASIGVTRFFLRDIEQTWYQSGLPGVAPDLRGVATELQRRLGDAGADHCCMIGNSMGGYAAIVIGALMNVSAVHAFSPQTFIGTWLRFLNWDTRWKRQIRSAIRTASADASLFDLRAFLRAMSYSTIINVHYSTSDRLDRIHAERLRGLSNVRLHAYSEGGHALVKTLRDSGRLREIIERDLLVAH